MKGFQTQVFKDVHLTVGSSVVVDCKLSVGQEVTTISVEVDPSQVDTSTSQISAVIARNQMENLPLNGRNFEQLILLAPGVQSVTTGTMNSFYGRENSYSIAGSRPEDRSRALGPFPMISKYKGAASIDDSANLACENGKPLGSEKATAARQTQ